MQCLGKAIAILGNSLDRDEIEQKVPRVTSKALFIQESPWFFMSITSFI